MSVSEQALSELPKDRLLAEFSLWSADLVRMADDIKRVDQFVDIYHADVSDGQFSPALLLFPDIMAQIRPLTTKPIHVHLMVEDEILIEQIDQFAEAGADIISVHAENENLDLGLDHIRSKGVATGVVMQLHTPAEAARALLDRIEILTLLGTKMGIKGVGLDDNANSRMSMARKLIDEQTHGHRILLAADGGIREHTVPGLRASGADTIVMGSLAFGADDLSERINWVHNLAMQT